MNHIAVSKGSISSAVGKGCVLIKGRQISLFRVHIPMYSASASCVYVTAVVSTPLSVLLKNK